MKKFLSILVFSLLALNVAYADDSYETAFKKALDNHQYYFKYKGKTYTTNTEEKPFDFFDHGYNYHEASLYMQKNYTDPSDGNFGCMLYKGHLRKFSDHLKYDKDGWKQITIAKSEDNLVKVILTESPTCMSGSNYFQVYFDNKEIFDSRPDFKKWTSKDWLIGLNINSYIDKDYNQNGVKELFIDAGYRLGNTWTEKYYFFEYDLNTITLKKSLLADDWKKRLGVSDHHKSKFQVTDGELAKVIIENFK